MRIDILTLFPEMFHGVLGASILKRAAEPVTDPATGQTRPAVVSYHLTDIRDHTENKHQKVDAPPYGGGPGMVMQCQPIHDAVRAAEAADSRPATRVLTSAQGEPFTQSHAEELARAERLLIVAGHYEGVDERVIDALQPMRELSIGDFILSGGELPAMVMIDAVVRLLPGVLGDEQSAAADSFSAGTDRLLDYPHYTRPQQWNGRAVPEALLSGDHARIAAWRREQARRRTAQRRPELLRAAETGGTDAAVIRPAREGDKPQLDRLLQDTRGQDAAAAIDRLRRDHPSTGELIATAGDAIVGHAAMWPGALEGERGGPRLRGLGPITVAAHWQDRGIDLAMLHEAVAEARECGAMGVVGFGDPALFNQTHFQPAALAGLTPPGQGQSAWWVHPFRRELPGYLQGHLAPPQAIIELASR